VERQVCHYQCSKELPFLKTNVFDIRSKPTDGDVDPELFENSPGKKLGEATNFPRIAEEVSDEK
jgi:hypothetical protein